MVKKKKTTKIKNSIVLEFIYTDETGVGVGVRTEINAAVKKGRVSQRLHIILIHTVFSPLCKQRRLKLMLCCTFHT